MVPTELFLTFYCLNILRKNIKRLVDLSVLNGLVVKIIVSDTFLAYEHPAEAVFVAYLREPVAPESILQGSNNGPLFGKFAVTSIKFISLTELHA